MNRITDKDLQAAIDRINRINRITAIHAFIRGLEFTDTLASEATHGKPWREPVAENPLDHGTSL